MTSRNKNYDVIIQKNQLNFLYDLAINRRCKWIWPENHKCPKVVGFKCHQHKLHREFWLQNGIGKTYLWKKYVLVHFDNQLQGREIFEFLHCPFEGHANMHHKIQPEWLFGQWHLAGGSKGQSRNSKNFPPNLLSAIKVRQKHIFSRYMVWLYHFKTRIHGVKCK